METPETQDFFVKRSEQVAENMLIALNNYTYEEAASMIDWL
ncbi:hypothetical protein GTGU_04098 [Trabulsiella guamensis ATCC 49490]|uniref:Uncharacterized protein n=1 Tax=Trabulsiella guamensis ATCC 49490 TaxID=1005994 RepID=A0A084ZQB5_9ENTR|nr:hypothetical protein GTGU_04098 [Trabulsiella guamensis ATCC 49490]